jgi:hypothetical protein
MKSTILIHIAAITLFAVLFLPVRPAAQVTGSGTPGHIPLWTNGTALGDSAIVQSQGKVGIGTSSPTAKLHVVGTGPNRPDALFAIGGVGFTGVSSGGGPGGAVQLTGGAGGRGCIACNFLGGGGGPVTITGGNGGQGFVRAGGGGQILMVAGRGGITSPALAPDTGGSGGAVQVGAGTGATFSGGGTHGGNGGSITLFPGAGGTGTGSNGSFGSILLAPSGGKIGIGTPTPTATLTVVAGGTTLADHWTIRSSRAFKADIQPLHDALSKVEQLQGVTYRSKVNGKKEIGVVAEDVERVIPEVVSRDPQTNEVQGVDYSRLAALLIEAVKTQQQQIQQLKAKVEQLSKNSR